MADPHFTRASAYIAPVSCTVSIIFGIAFTVTGALGIFHPPKMAETFGLAPTDAIKSTTAFSKTHPSSPWIPVAAVRNLSFGLLNLTLVLRNDFRTLGIMYMLCMPVAAFDGWAVWTMGVREKYLGHSLGVPILGLVGYFLTTI